MHKVIFLLVACIFVQVLADKYDWFPSDYKDIMLKCKEEHPLSMTTIKEMQSGEFNDSPTFRALILCTTKGLKVYSTEKGFDAERFAYALYRTGATRVCNRERIQRCVTQQKEVQPEGAMAYNVIKCIIDSEKTKTTEDGPHTELKGCD